MRNVLCERWLACLIAIFAAREAAGIDTVWNYTTPAGHIAGSPAVGDVDGDGFDEIAVADTAGNIVVLNGAGQTRWRRNLPAPITIAPTLADVYPGEPEPDSSPLELLVVNGVGTLYCLDAGTGRLIWKYTLPHDVDWGRTSIGAADLNADGQAEIIAGDSAGVVVCLSGEGEALWVYEGTHGHTLCPASGDVNGDGLCETFIAGSSTALVCLSHEGKELWRLGEKVAGASPVVWDLDGDARPEIVAGIGNELTVVNGDGTVRWKHTMPQEMDSAITVADADQDGTPEIYAVDLSGALACLAHDGTLRWSGTVGQRVRRSPSVADIDGDGVTEILVAGYSAAIHVFAPDGTLEEQIPLPGPTNATATVVTVGSGTPDTWRVGVVCPTQEGALQALRWPQAPARTVSPWPAYRMDSARTAALPRAPRPVRIAAADLGAGEMKGNVYRVQIENPEQRRVTVTLEVQGDGVRTKRDSRSSSEKRIEMNMPYRIAGRAAACLAFSCTVAEGEAIVARQTSHAYVAPFAQEIAEAQGRLAALHEPVAQLADPSGAEERLCFLETTLREQHDRIMSQGALSVRERGDVQDTLEETFASVRRLLGLVDAAVATQSMANGSLLICAANPWAPFGGMDEAIEGRTPSPELRVEAFGGETEAAALNIFNFGGTPRTLRVTLDPLTSKGAAPRAAEAVKAKEVVTLHEALDVPTMIMDFPSADALPILNQAMTITVPAGEARQLWLNVNVAPLAPGEWASVVHLRTLEVESVELIAPLDIAVWKAALPKEQALSLCHWANVAGTYLKDYPEEALHDQVSHGTNVFVSSQFPLAKYNEHGDLVGEIDFAAHDEYVRRHAPHGIIMFCGYQGSLQGPGTHRDAPYQKAYRKWVRAWVKHLAGLGVGYDGFAFYPIDEIGLRPGLVQDYLMYARLTREADPKVLMYTDPTAGAMNEEEWPQLVPYVDIWCPNSTGYLGEFFHDELEFMKATGKTVWTYECFGIAKHQSPLDYYRGHAWLAWHHGLTGFGFWTYCSSADDPWFVPRANSEYVMVYPGEGVVSSKRWEAVRDGIEDYSMLAVLRDTLKRTSAQQSHPDVFRRAQRVLGEEASAIAERALAEEKVARPPHDGLAERRKEADTQWQRYRTLRAEIARLLAGLTSGESL